MTYYTQRLNDGTRNTFIVKNSSGQTFGEYESEHLAEVRAMRLANGTDAPIADRLF